MPRVSPSEAVADRRLVKGLNEGDEAALAALYDEYGERLYDYAVSMTADETAAAGIVHDTFIDACRRAPRMRDHLHLSSWLYGASRRRCLREGRAQEPYWDPDAEFPDAPFMDRAGTGEPDDEWPPSEELHELLRAGMARLEPVDQEVVVLAFRHGLRPTRLGAALGLSTRRAALRIRRGRDALEAAVADELHNAVVACAGGVAVLASRDAAPHRGRTRGPRSGRLWRTAHRRGEVPEPSGDPVLDEHVARCPDCRRRGQVRAAALLGRAPAPVLPAALRHRVMHTATDPELAGYRADIAARGGTLTPEGLPSQPDVPSPFTRKWLITGGGMAGALVAALVAVFVMGPGLGGDPLSWPPLRTRPQPSITHQAPSSGPRPGDRDPHDPKRQGQPAPVVPGPGAGSPTVRQGKEGQETTAPTSPSPTPPPGTEPPQGPGDLLVAPAKVELYGTRTATVRLAAKSGPVTWKADSSSNRLTLSQTEGGMPEDGTSVLTLTLDSPLIGLPGRGTVTFKDAEGTEQTVTVVWGASVL
ncbi:sigma factor [Actinomadura terrae]|uniref:sigma factor n=1 Tax=Actinomadura terrae TaxID=604353 RepID=UPI001FA80AB2|nr:sigma factor [Actinomadura terrae]